MKAPGPTSRAGHGGGSRLGNPDLGFCVGLRTTHFAYIEEHALEVDSFEAVTENFLDSGGRPRHMLDQVAERYPVTLHGVSLSIGSTDPLDLEYLAKLKRLAAAVRAVWVSDHVCWTAPATRTAPSTRRSRPSGWTSCRTTRSSAASPRAST